jgi:hypothetical protein
MSQRVRTVELQLLRHGPPHNQLLSPLTDYLALCGDHPNTTLHFPIEHQSLKVRLHALRYKDSEDTRKIQLHETASLVGQMLAEVPGLISELGHRDANSETLVHLSVATTASELSLVPFELANAPSGFPGAGGLLSLQTEFPICITRRSRKVRFDQLDWDVKPRILMIASDAGGDIPVEAHYSLLRKLVEPWVYRNPLETDDESLSEVRKHLVLLDGATVRKVRETIHSAIDQHHPFTHIHILAHGCPLPNQDESYGVAFYHPSGRGIDAVDGLRLGQLLNGKLAKESRRKPDGDQVRPNVVTLAVCDSANTGLDVSRPVSSVAFNIHEAGIPLVIGSQFPLTKDGSVVLTDSLYRQLLDGRDPRICLWEARREVFSHSVERLSPDSVGRHDWASIICFAAFPPTIEQASRRLEQSQYRRRMSVRLESGERLMGAINGKRTGLEFDKSNRDNAQILNSVASDVMSEVRMFDVFVDDRRSGSSDYVDLLGISASANKQAAELLYAQQHYFDAATYESHEHKNLKVDDTVWLECIWQSYRRYILVSRRDANQSWAFVQALFLKTFISMYRDNSSEMVEQGLYEDWFHARYQCADRDQIECLNSRELIWHLTNRIELGLLRTLIPWFSSPSTGVRKELKETFSTKELLRWLRQIDQIGEGGGRAERFAVFSCRRQLLRYRTFAGMMYLDPSSKGARSAWKKRSILNEGGFDRLTAANSEFNEMYREIEAHVLEQIEIGEGA